MTDLKPIRSDADYEEALAGVERLWGAPAGTPDGDRLDILATLIDAYETQHYPIDPPDPVEAIKFRMEQQGLSSQGFGTVDRHAHPRGRSSEPQAEPIDHHDPPPA